MRAVTMEQNLYGLSGYINYTVISPLISKNAHIQALHLKLKRQFENIDLLARHIRGIVQAFGEEIAMLVVS